MPHLTVHALEDDLTGREEALAQALTSAVADIYGQWARELVSIQLIGLPAGRWAVGGKLVLTASPAVTFGVRAGLFERPDAGELVPRLVASVTDAVTSVFGEQVRAGVTVELVATQPGRTGVGGLVAD
jgi:phenylpyruvate tautomerase PptA (4-oxalocrotonate tautomerase family)